MNAKPWRIGAGNRSPDRERAALVAEQVHRRLPSSACSIVPLAMPRRTGTQGEAACAAQAIEAAISGGLIDFGVADGADLPIDLAPGIVVAAVLPRGPVEDALVTRGERTLLQLPRHARIGTAGTRQRAAVLRARPDVECITLGHDAAEGLAALDSGRVEAVIVPGASLALLAPRGRTVQMLPATVFTPPPGQGASIILAREDDDALLQALALLDDEEARLRVFAERAVLHALHADEATPLGVLAELRGRRLEIHAKVWSADGADCAGASIAGSAWDDSRLALELAYELSLRGAGALIAAARPRAETGAVVGASGVSETTRRDLPWALG